MDALEFLSGHVPLFKGLPEQELIPLAQNSALKQFAAGQTVLYAGMSVDGLHVIAVGKVGVHAKVPNKGVVRVAELAMGDVFGETSILDRSLAGASVKAGEEGAVVLLIPEDPFRRLYADNADFRARVDALVAARKPPSKPAAA